MKKTSLSTSLIIALSLLSGCASITKDSNQPVQVETYSKDNKLVSGAKCTARNERGEWTTTSTGTMSVHRSGQNLIVKCEKEGEETGHGTVVSRANGGMFGNILFGGGIGAIIDHNKGTAYSYPDWIRIILGDNLVFDRKNNKDNEVMIGQSATPEQLKKIETDKVAEENAAEEKAEKEKLAADAAATNNATNPPVEAAK
jgi:hypothetical protein